MDKREAVVKSATQQPTAYMGKALRNGHLSLPKTALQKLGLRQGDVIEVVLRPVEAAPADTEREVPEAVRSLVEELVGPQPSRERAVEALTRVAVQMLLPRKQRRLSHLLWKNQAGEITPEEEKELDELVTEGEEGTIRKAKAILALQRLGVDIVPELEARVRSTL